MPEGRNGVLVAVAPAPHESTHVSGGSDDIDSALAAAAIPGHEGTHVDTGSDEISTVAGLNGLPSAGDVPKVKLETRVMTAASGDVSYTGYGFTPVGLIIIARGGGTQALSVGSAEPALAEQSIAREWGNAVVVTTNIVRLENGNGDRQDAVLKTYDGDGFTLTWTKTSTPTGTATLHVFAFA